MSAGCAAGHPLEILHLHRLSRAPGRENGGFVADVGLVKGGLMMGKPNN
jgi:hypothetical protein